VQKPPPHGGAVTEWLGNAEVFERNRKSCEQGAAQARKNGDEILAATFDELAETNRQSRDAEQRRETRRRNFRRFTRW